MAESVTKIGIKVADPNTLCPTSDRVCPARESLVAAYSEHCLYEIAISLPHELQPRFDQLKLQTRLAEYTCRAHTIGCQGPEGKNCPIRESMDNGPARRRIVDSLQRILRKTI